MTPFTHQLVDGIKRKIREAGMNYKDVARGIGLSEVSVKRIFANRELSLVRLEKIAELLSIDLYQLIEETKSNSEQVWRFTHEQEKVLASDLRLYLFTFQIIHGVSLKALMKRQGINIKTVESYLLKLDRIKIVFYSGKLKFKLIIPPNVTWNPNGPLARKIVLPTMRYLVERISREESPMVAEYFVSKMSQSFFFEYKNKIRKLSKEIFMRSLNLEKTTEELKQVGVIMSMCPLNSSVSEILQLERK